MGIQYSQPSIFILQNTDVPDLPITFSQELVASLQKGISELTPQTSNSSAKIDGELAQLESRFMKYLPVLTRLREFKLNEALLASQESVRNCYIQNPGRVLDCWQEVDEFKTLSNKAMEDFLKS